MKRDEPWKERHYDVHALFARIFKHRIIDPVTGCWLWPSRGGAGYGLIHFAHKGHTTTMRIHRLVAWLYFGYDGNKSVEVCHRCNVKACFNPAHLYLASHQQNMADARRDKLWRRERGWKIKKKDEPAQLH